MSRPSVVLLAASLAAAACTGVISDPFGGTSGGNAGPGGADPIGTGGAPLECTEPDAPGPRLLRLLTREEYAASVADLLAVERPSIDDLPIEPRVAGFDNNAGAAVVTSRHVDAYLAIADTLVRKSLATSKATLVGCDLATASCRADFVKRFGRRAFRRPLQGEEVARYEAMFAPDLTAGAHDEGVALVVTSMLISPSFLYRSEIGEPSASDGTYALTPFEVASALSFTFRGEGPDDALLDAAASGKLSTEAGVDAEAKRLLEDPKSRVQVARFFGQWLDSGALLSANKDKAIYPSFTDAVREGLAAEQAAFVDHVTFESTGRFDELLTADYVFANDAVASFYGLPGGLGAAPKKVAAGGNRGGLLTLGSVLASQAHANESSPIKRGKWVRDRLLCQDLPPPPANADTTPPGLDPSLTTRERFAKHTSDPACRSCHQFIDGVGFGFERYDGVGAYRETENGKPIDASGEIKGREGLGTNSSEPFDGPHGLASLLAKGESAPRCFATQWWRFARGTKEEGKDACAARTLATKFLERDKDIKTLLTSVVTQRSFLLRRSDEGGSP